jgi:hypothetical protein
MARVSTHSGSAPVQGAARALEQSQEFVPGTREQLLTQHSVTFRRAPPGVYWETVCTPGSLSQGSLHHAGPLILILTLAHEHDPDPEMRPYKDNIDVELREKLILGIAGSVPAIYRYFAPHRRRTAAKPSLPAAPFDGCYDQT